MSNTKHQTKSQEIVLNPSKQQTANPSTPILYVSFPRRSFKRKTPSETGISEEDEDCIFSEDEPPSPSPPPVKRVKTEVEPATTPAGELDARKVGMATAAGILEWEGDAERMFCLSLVPIMRRLDPDKRSLAKLHIQRLLHNLEFPQVKVELRSV